MEQPQTRTLPVKMSFAKIAAMPAPSPPLNINSKSTSKYTTAKEEPKNMDVHKSEHPEPSQKSRTSVPSRDPKVIQTLPMTVELMDNAIARLALNQEKANSERTADSRESADSFEDEQSQLSVSSLNKHSFDTKSMTSVTTFAMDDPEGIRPDESASVRAADDEIPQIGLSRNSSFQQEIEAPPTAVKHMRHISANVTIAGRRYPTLTNPPRFGNLPVSPEFGSRPANQDLAPPILQIDEPSEIITPVIIAPDEKLLDALVSSKERLPLLQLEEKVLAFISGNGGDFLELPPQNSFARLLAHKLADYYGLAHHMNEDNNSVRMFRTNSRTIPTPLAHLAKSIPVGSTSTPSIAAVKIMRRANLGFRNISAGNSTAPSSSVPSKTTSENGTETNSEEGVMSPIDGTPGKDKSKLTREEREAQYKAARERIFGDFQESVTSESASTGDHSASMSRSSSCSGKKKTRKHRQVKDDSFEARSAFIPSYSTASSQYHPGYNETTYSNVYNGQTEPFSPNMYATTPTQGYVGFDQNFSYGPQPNYPVQEMQHYQNANWQPMNGSQVNYYPYQSNTPQQQSMQPPPHVHMSAPQHLMSAVPGQYMHQPPQSVQQPQNWMYNQFNGYAAVPNQQNMAWQGYNQSNNMHPVMQAYPFNQAYGNQFSSGAGHGDAKSLFNPQTRSFIPSNNGGRGGRGNRKKNHGGKQIGNSGSGTSSAMSGNSSPRPKEDSLQQKYGTPASLPKKPPTSEIVSGNSIPTFGSSSGNNSVTNNTATTANQGPLVVNGTGNVHAS